MQHKATLEDTLELMRDLRRRCDWDAAQTHDSLRPYLIEEAHELDDALRDGTDAQRMEELGDLLLQVLFHSVVAEERRAFDIGDVAESLIAKMHRRHPHLYGGGVKAPWEQLKAQQRRNLTDGLPSGLPPLHRAHRLQDRAAGVGFDWEDSEGPARKVEEEIGEVRALLAPKPAAVPSELQAKLEDELGDLLFAVVNLCRKTGVHASLALDKANAKFARRFDRVVTLAASRGLDVATVGLRVLDAIWDEVKLAERNEP